MPSKFLLGFGGEDEDIPIVAQNINKTEATTTLMARSGQTVVFSGLIQEEKTHVMRGAPIISDLPVVGPLFKYEADRAVRSELMIIMTPYLVTDDEDLMAHNQDEMERMHWCLCDVAEVYGNTDFGSVEGIQSQVQTVYPDADPTGSQIVVGGPQSQPPIADQPTQSAPPAQPAAGTAQKPQGLFERWRR